MTFEDLVDQVLAMLQRRGRVTYRALKRQFALDDAAVEDLKEELCFAHPQVAEEDGRGLVWQGDSRPISPPAVAPETAPLAWAPPSTPGPDLRTYTPPHLVEKILTSHAALHGERKQVTVLFCDLANSTGLAEQLGPERMHTVLNQFFEDSMAIVHRYEGTINQFLGDGFMALFGAPIAHEDHARRAVLAALELRHQHRMAPASHTDSAGVELTVRMGINTGIVVVGAIGDSLRMDYTAVGDTTNVAARLQQEARTDQIVISEATHRLVAGYCTTQALGALALKGKAAPVPAWEVLAARATRTRLDVEAERGLTPFIGRTQELRTLQTCLAHAQAGHGHVVFLVGEAGIGKSRLLLEFRRHLDVGETTWLEGRALSFGQSMTLHPVLDLLKRIFQIDDGDVEETILAKMEPQVLRLGEDLRPILPYLRYLLAVNPGEETVQRLDPQLRRAELFDALRRLLVRAAEVRPQVLVLEDLHWMDKATEDFLVAIADSLPTSRVLCLLTYRPGYVHPFGERTYHTRLVLTPLSSADTVQMAQRRLAAAQLPEDLQTLLVARAEGNPFFVEEMLKSLQESGGIRRVDDRVVLTTPLEAMTLPDTIHDVLMARIDRLPEIWKQTLQRAAVIGREFPTRLLERLGEHAEPMATALHALQAMEFIYEKSRIPEPVYLFKHALTQEVAYHALLEQQRQDLHRRIGETIEAFAADRVTEQSDVLAYHFAQGQVWAKALRYFCQAAEKAAQAFATRAAVTLYAHALEAAQHLGSAVDAQTLMAIHREHANLYFILSDFARSRAAAERHFALAQASGDQVQVGTALVGIGWAALWAQEFYQALHYVQQAIAVAQPLEASAVLAKSYVTAGLVHEVTGVLDQSREEITHALTISRAIGDVACQVFALLEPV